MVLKRQKKIMLVITKSNFGGAQKYVYEIAVDLKDRGYDVVVALGGEGILRDKLKFAKIRTVSIDSLQRDINIFSDFKSIIELFKLIRKEKPDVIHLNSSKVGAIGGLVARTYMVPKIIYTIHGLAFNENRSFLSKIIIKNIYWFSIAMSHKSIAVSKGLKQQLLNTLFFELLTKKIFVIKNGVKPVDFYSRDKSRKFIEEKIGHDLSEKKIIGTVAELHHIKGLDYLIEAARRVTDKDGNIIFVVFGEGDERENLERLIRENGLTQKFFLLGFVDEASRYMKGLDMFVLSSLSEALALVILEAKQAKLKIVATKVGGVPEALDNYNQSIMSEPRDFMDLANKIETLLKVEFPEKKDKKEDDSFIKMIEKTIRLYNSK